MTVEIEVSGVIVPVHDDAAATTLRMVLACLRCAATRPEWPAGEQAGWVVPGHTVMWEGTDKSSGYTAPKENVQAGK
ncbi:MAG: hypothetical protein ACKO8N_09690 [Rubrivivax sp.]